MRELKCVLTDIVVIIMCHEGGEIKKRTERGIPSAPQVFDQRHGVGMNKPLAPSRTAEVFTTHEIGSMAVATIH